MLIRSPAGIVVIEMILLAGLMFATFSVLVRVTDMETVGLWVLVNALLGFSRVADFWSRGVSTFVGAARGHGERDEAVAFVSTAVVSGLAGYAILAAVGASAIWMLAELIAGAAHANLVREIVPLMAVTFWLLAVGGIYQGGFLAFGRPKLKAAQTVGGALIFLLLALLLAPGYGLWGILVAQALQGVVMLAYAIVAFHGFLARGCGALWRRDQFAKLAVYGSKAMAVSMLQLAIDPVIRLLASQFGGFAEVAAVELASRLIGVVRSIITALGQILVPEFARIDAAARSEISALYKDTSKLFLLASLSAFSLLISSASAVEEIVLERTGTGFVSFLWILSAGWFANTVTAPAYFLLLSQRRLKPLFLSHLIMTTGAVALGVAGGLLSGANGAMAGAALALVSASIYLMQVTGGTEMGLASLASHLRMEPARLFPFVSAIVAVVLVKASGLPEGDIVARSGGYAATIGATLITCLVFGDIKGIVHMAARLR